jgi:AcrR family transcriptional regulator
MMRLTRAESQAETRAKLLDAAAMVIAERGYTGASVETIAEAAGFSKGAVYSNFASKEALVLALVETVTDAFKRMSFTITAHHTEDPQSFYKAMTTLYVEDEAPRVVPLELLMQARREPALRPAMAKAYRERWDRWGKTFETAIARLGGQPAAETKILVEAIMATMVGQSLLSAGGVKISTRRVLLDVLLRALLRLGETPPEPPA